MTISLLIKYVVGHCQGFVMIFNIDDMVKHGISHRYCDYWRWSTSEICHNGKQTLLICFPMFNSNMINTNWQILSNLSCLYAPVTLEPNQQRIHPNTYIRVDSGSFCSPSPNERKVGRDSGTFVEGFGSFWNVQNQPNTLKTTTECGPAKFHSGHIRALFGKYSGRKKRRKDE